MALYVVTSMRVGLLADDLSSSMANLRAEPTDGRRIPTSVSIDPLARRPQARMTDAPFRTRCRAAAAVASLACVVHGPSTIGLTETFEDRKFATSFLLTSIRSVFAFRILDRLSTP